MDRSFRAFTSLVFAGVLLAGMGTSLPAAPREARTLEALGASGMFLAGIVANSQRDTGAAAEYFREALKADPRNPGLLDQAFLAELVDGNLDEAFRLAERSIQRDQSNALAHVALGVRALKVKNFQRARKSFDRAGGKVRNADLTIGMLRAWAIVGAGDIGAALKAADSFTDKELVGYRDFVSGLMADVGKRPAEAEARLAKAHAAEPTVLRVADAYARVLSRRNKLDEALKVARGWRERNPSQPFLTPDIALYEKGQPRPPLVDDVAEGAAEVFYSLGAMGSAARDPMTAVIYLQLAHYLAPADALIGMTLAEYFEQLGQHQRASQLYEAVPPESVLAHRAAIGRAVALERLGKTDESISVLRSLLIREPGDLEATDTLGAILRTKKRWEESAEVYDGALKAAGVFQARHWSLFYGRAIAYERSKKWDKAEPDFLAALDLLPVKPRNAREGAERAQVLNYLAYSWADMHKNVDKAFEMLREAVALSPGDGAIVDSLGWAYYRLGRYDEAVKELERAVLLKSGDPTINDHLGDAYWKVGRQREAYYKWGQALELNPEPDDEKKIRQKLESGMEEGPAANAGAPKPNGG
ncbi:MAG TPA: tetratricopeptide repeat protein [Rhabdaerophilum sp.]|nr:tetratricopeptide repeat protein [Rhabdaerophilum sp.]